VGLCRIVQRLVADYRYVIDVISQKAQEQLARTKQVLKELQRQTTDFHRIALAADERVTRKSMAAVIRTAGKKR
jgi:cell division septum initiation protein DivIVA